MWNSCKIILTVTTTHSHTCSYTWEDTEDTFNASDFFFLYLSLFLLFIYFFCASVVVFPALAFDIDYQLSAYANYCRLFTCAFSVCFFFLYWTNHFFSLSVNGFFRSRRHQYCFFVLRLFFTTISISTIISSFKAGVKQYSSSRWSIASEKKKLIQLEKLRFYWVFVLWWEVKTSATERRRRRIRSCFHSLFSLSFYLCIFNSFINHMVCCLCWL